jgi:hypothetical protein
MYWGECVLQVVSQLSKLIKYRFQKIKRFNKFKMLRSFVIFESFLDFLTCLNLLNLSLLLLSCKTFQVLRRIFSTIYFLQFDLCNILEAITIFITDLNKH